MNQMREKNPFFVGYYKGNPFYKTAAADRIEAIREFSSAQCLAAVELPEVLQKSVRKELQKRLKIVGA